MPEKLFKQAQECYKSGNPAKPNDVAYDEALKLLANVIDSGEYVEETLNLRWHIYYLRGDLSKALDDLNDAIRKTPLKCGLFYNRGFLKHHIKEYESALADFRVAVDLASKQGNDDLIDAAEHHIVELNQKLGFKNLGGIMAQVKVYGLKTSLKKHQQALSDTIHDALEKEFALPSEKRFQRFIGLEKEEFIFPSDRSENYTIIEFSVFEGRSPEAKKKLMTSLFTLIAERVGIAPQDLEITIFETPQANWGIRGLPGDELSLNYKIKV